LQLFGLRLAEIVDHRLLPLPADELEVERNRALRDLELFGDGTGWDRVRGRKCGAEGWRSSRSTLDESTGGRRWPSGGRNRHSKTPALQEH
jgi:hypothetical protein